MRVKSSNFPSKSDIVPLKAGAISSEKERGHLNPEKTPFWYHVITVP